jgi:hypothetical protein
MSTAFRLVPITAKDKVSLSWFSLEFYLIILVDSKLYRGTIKCCVSRDSSVAVLPQNDIRRSTQYDIGGSAEDNCGIGKRYGL